MNLNQPTPGSAIEYANGDVRGVIRQHQHGVFSAYFRRGDDWLVYAGRHASADEAGAAIEKEARLRAQARAHLGIPEPRT